MREHIQPLQLCGDFSQSVGELSYMTPNSLYLEQSQLNYSNVATVQELMKSLKSAVMKPR